MHVFVGTTEGLMVKSVTVDGVPQDGVVEASDEGGFIIRYATPEEVERLVTKPGLVWPRDKDVLIQVRGEVGIELFP